ncbi:hypothetical protein KIW84_015469 [Lathyrus oleraceus]|uniref:Uncharacterized protein n=1 Tax=Pisum sativum TaxID=3888 RepID=A0A9D5H0S7_PEA|nr:hypothetical protein KIW84_015469 [Pisum sativum]
MWQFKSIEEAVIEGVKSIATNCIKSGTVRKLIYTGTVLSSSPLKDDGSDYKNFIDETCWTPLHLPLTALHKEYVGSKTLAEKELSMSYGNGGIEVVSLAVGLVGGDALLSYIPVSVASLIAQVKDDEAIHESLKFVEDICGKIPLVHVDDVCEAHIFCAENPSIKGRFLLANSYASSAEISNYYLQNYPEFNLKEKYLEGPRREIKWASAKLIDEGFVYKHDLKMILDDSIKCARRIGDLNVTDIVFFKLKEFIGIRWVLILVKEWEQVHVTVLTKGFCSDVFVNTNLINFYANQGGVEQTRHVLMI